MAPGIVSACPAALFTAVVEPYVQAACRLSGGFIASTGDLLHQALSGFFQGLPIRATCLERERLSERDDNRAPVDAPANIEYPVGSFDKDGHYRAACLQGEECGSRFRRAQIIF